MAKLMYVIASPRKDRSHSIAVADAFVDAYREMHPEDHVVTLNVFEAELPAFDGVAVAAKYKILHGLDHSEQEAEAWQVVESLIEDFTWADKYVFAVPMWNFGIPYRLKQYLDNLVQPGFTFSFSPEEGYKGLVVGKPVLAIYARGGEYPPGTDAETVDFQKRYLEAILGFMGFTDIRSIVVEPTLQGGPVVAAQKRDDAVRTAKAMAGKF